MNDIPICSPERRERLLFQTPELRRVTLLNDLTSTVSYTAQQLERFVHVLGLLVL
jgi:hypothetical protein